MDRFIDKLRFDEQSFYKLAPDHSERSTAAQAARTVLYVAVIIAIFTYWFTREKIQVPNAPFITPKSIWDFQWRDAKLKFQSDCIGIVNKGFKMASFLTARRSVVHAKRCPPHLGWPESFSCHF